MFSFNKLSFMPRSIWVVGCGGTGSRLIQPLAQMVAARGIPLRTNIFMIDGDTVEAKNCSRQLFIDENIGQHKANVLADRYQGLYNHVNMVSLNRYLSFEEVLGGFTDDSLGGAWEGNIERSMGIPPSGAFSAENFNISDISDGFSPSARDDIDRFKENSLFDYCGEVSKAALRHVSSLPDYTAVDKATNASRYSEYVIVFLENKFGSHLGRSLACVLLHLPISSRDPCREWSRKYPGVVNLGGEHLRKSQLILETIPEEYRDSYSAATNSMSSFAHLANIRNFETSLGLSSWFYRSITDCDNIDEVHRHLGEGGGMSGAMLRRMCASANTEGESMSRDGNQSSPDIYLRDLYNSFIEPDIIVLGVDSAKARREVLTLANMTTSRKLSGSTQRNIIVVDPGNEDTFGQVSVSCLGRKPSLPVTGKVCASEPYAKRALNGSDGNELVDSPLLHQMITPSMGIDGTTPQVYDDLGSMLSLVPNKGFFNEELKFAPWSPTSMLLRRNSEIELSCADLDQTLAINNMMAASVISTVQNVLLNQAMSMETIRFSLVSNTTSQPTDIPWLKSKFGEGELNESSVVYMAVVPLQDVETPANKEFLQGQSLLLCTYRYRGMAYLDVYRSGTMECIYTNHDVSMFDEYVDIEFSKPVAELTRKELLLAKLVFSSLTNDQPYPEDMGVGFSSEYLSMPTLSISDINRTRSVKHSAIGFGLISNIDKALADNHVSQMVNQISEKVDVTYAESVANEVAFKSGVVSNTNAIFDVSTVSTIGRPSGIKVDITSSDSMAGIGTASLITHVSAFSGRFGSRTNHTAVGHICDGVVQARTSMPILQSMVLASRMLSFVKTRGGIHDSISAEHLRAMVESEKAAIDKRVLTSALFTAQFIPSDPYTSTAIRGSSDVLRSHDRTFHETFNGWQSVSMEQDTLRSMYEEYSSSVDTVMGLLSKVRTNEGESRRLFCDGTFNRSKNSPKSEWSDMDSSLLVEMPEWFSRSSTSGISNPMVSSFYDTLMWGVLKNWSVDLFAAPIVEEIEVTVSEEVNNEEGAVDTGEPVAMTADAPF